MTVAVVANKLTDAMRSDFKAAFTEAKRIAGIDAPITVHEHPYYGDGPTLGLGVKGYDYLTLSPKQIVTRGLGVSFLQQALQQAVLNKPRQVPLTLGVNYHIVSDIEALTFASDTIVIDIEVAGNINKDPWATNSILAIALYDGVNAYVIPEELAETAASAALVGRLLAYKSVVTWNGTFDIPYLTKRLSLNTRLRDTHDAMLMHYCLYNTAGEHGLKPVARRFLGAPDWDANNSKYTVGGAHYENIPRPQLYEYAAADVYYTYQLYLLFHELLESTPRARAIYEQRMKYSSMLQDIQRNGIPVDQKKLAVLREQHVEEKEAALQECREIVGSDTFNPGSPQQLKKAFEALGVTLPNTSKDTLKKARRAHPVLEPLIEAVTRYRAASKVIGSYIDNMVPLIGDDGKVHPGYKPHGSVTGRLSATSPAIQTIPRGVGGVRSAFRVPDDNHAIVQTDFAQAELRTVAELSGDPDLIEAFGPNAPDFFDNLMTKIYPEEFPTIETYRDFAAKDPAAAESKRALVKGTVYGCVPTDTKVLTRRGLLYYDQLLPGDETWSHKGRWSKITGIVHYSKAPVTQYRNRTYRFQVTDNHRWPRHVRSDTAKGYGRVIVEPISEIPKSSLLVMCPDPAVEVEATAMDPIFGARLLLDLKRGKVTAAEALQLPDSVQKWAVEQLSESHQLSLKKEGREAIQVLGFIHGQQFIYKEYEKSTMCQPRKARITRLGRLFSTPLGEMPVFCLTTEDGTWTMEQADQLMVTGNSNYGRSVPAIAEALNISVGSAQAVMDSYYGAYPGLKKWQAGVREAVGKPELRWRLTTPYGMQFVQEVVSNYNRTSAENEALASVPQSTANEITLRAALEIHRRLEQFEGAHIVALVHDNIAVLCRKEDAEKIGAMMEREMQGAAHTAGFFRVPFIAEAEIGDSLDH